LKAGQYLKKIVVNLQQFFFSSMGMFMLVCQLAWKSSINKSKFDHVFVV